ncbi:UPAR/Ly6 domain-containing protein crok-like [Artemia franciscana]|uniref:Protein sleepless n=1 Tax=Artemia franciscana TaxID=6661 RepID=A0AA88LIV0_ARTSF|nr:hypothetical protein QYM36_000025 [Artemia franciscana]
MVEHYIFPLFIVMFLFQNNLCNALKCYDCNSAFDPRCGENFDNSTIALVDCDQRQANIPGMKDQKATICRRVIENVGGIDRIIRTCGWLEDEGMEDCFRKSTPGVKYNYCICRTDACNSVGVNALFPSLLVLTIVIKMLN